ncbi:MAG: nitroreductase family protein [Chlorobiaceae bacterium]|nr:nitroreductase family protein [Chlorobiaceae bacterium]
MLNMKEEQMAQDAMSVICRRRSVRDFTDAGIDEHALEALVRAGMSAPTARNMQPWSFIVLTGRETLDRLSEGLPYGKMLATATAAIAVCALPEEANGQSVELAVVDATCASENILLAAEAFGLGAVWVAAYPYEDRMAHVRSILNIPDGVIPLNVIPLGHPKASKPPIDKYRPEKIHRESW